MNKRFPVNGKTLGAN